MSEWSQNAQNSANSDMQDESPGEPVQSCPQKQWEPVLEIEEPPDWETALDVGSDEFQAGWSRSFPPRNTSRFVRAWRRISTPSSPCACWSTRSRTAVCQPSR